jgi:hypothetical protein
MSAMSPLKQVMPTKSEEESFRRRKHAYLEEKSLPQSDADLGKPGRREPLEPLWD